MRLWSLIVLLVSLPVAAESDWPVLSGPYLGQEPPGMTPEVFAPGLISSPDARELNSVFSREGRVFLFTREIDGIFKMFVSAQRRDGTWSPPFMTSLSRTFPGHRDADMAFSPDGDWLYFISDRPLPGYSLDRYNIWRSRNSSQGFHDPEPLGPHVNGPGHELYPVLVGDGSLYFSAARDDSLGGRDVYRAQFEDGEFGEPVRLGPGVNSEWDEGDVYVSPDETYMIHVAGGRPDSLGGSDLYVSFRQPDGTWGQDIHLGDGINSEDIDYCPMVTPDGKYFFFTQGNDVMWVDMAVIESHRPAD